MIALKKIKIMIIDKVIRLLILVSLSIVPLSLEAQSEEYRDDQGVLVGTSDSRMFMTVVESPNHVEFQICAIGEMTGGAYVFVMIYDTVKLVLTDPTYQIDIPNGSNNYPMQVISIPSSFSAKHPGYYSMALQHRPVLGGEASRMKMFCAETGMSSQYVPPVRLSPGEVIHLYSMHYRKVSPGTPLETSDFGYFAEGNTPPLLSPAWIWGPYKVMYTTSMPWDNFIVKKELFTYRSPSYVTSDSVSYIQSFSATLNGAFTRGDFHPADDIMVSRHSSADNTGRINWDDITKYGFIYSKTDATIVANWFSNKLNIDGTDCDFPDVHEIAAGAFIREGKTFYIQQVYNNSSSDQTVPFSQNLTDLAEGTTYHAWSFIHYNFETSTQALNVGEKLSFKTLGNACPVTVDFEGGPYNVTALAGLCWTDNMATRHYADGDPIPFAKAYYCSECQDSTELANTFGLLYTWYSAVGIQENTSDLPTLNADGFVQGICPDGWHVPSQEELNLLRAFPAKDLKSTDYWLVPGTNASGFNALPAGKYSGDIDRFIDMFGFTGYWAYDATPDQYAHYFSLTYYCSEMSEFETIKTDGLSVRCVMDY